jgi:L-alanine-DL-glutamate epimerase-like enolase superfamily enzyme
VRLTVVKITTDQDGLYGYGCATFTQRADLVNPAVDKYLKPFLVGKTTDRIEDIWQSCYDSSYWKNGPVLNNAISGIDQALWDIEGRQAGMPVYQLAGGKCREAAACYAHADGADFPMWWNPPSAIWRKASAMCASMWAFQGWRHAIGTPSFRWHLAAANAKITGGSVV